MSGRAYLSIGDVLSLLRQEFPDITISKIRFLESQGLVDPERSPSGYRKFYEGDVDRLRWVLRQQREHFLPLKVIRDRLAAAGNGVPPDDVADELPDQAAAEVAAVNGGVGSPAAPVVVSAAPAAESSNEVVGLAASGDLAASGLGWIAAERERLATLAAAPVGGAGVATSGTGHAPAHAAPAHGTAGVAERHADDDGWGRDEVEEEPMVRVGAPAAQHLAGRHSRAGGNGAPGRSGPSPTRMPAPAASLIPDQENVPAALVVAPPEAEGLLSEAIMEPAAASTPAVVTASAEVAAAAEAGAPPASGATDAAWSSPNVPAPAPSDPPADQPVRGRGAGGAGAPESGSGRAPSPRASRQVPAPTPAPAAPAPVPGGVGGSPGDVLAASVSGVSLTLEELCTASGLSAVQIGTLESFGLLAPMPVAGVGYYDEEALTVAKLVAEFDRYGIEPRHLRLYRNAVDREVGLIEQVITPLLRQRNPEARQRAVSSAADLVRLGQGLRAALVRVELRRQLGG